MPQRAACLGLTLALALWVGAAAAGERVIKGPGPATRSGRFRADLGE